MTGHLGRHQTEGASWRFQNCRPRAAAQRSTPARARARLGAFECAFLIPGKGRAVPYGVYDIAANEGWVSVGIDHDTATFAVESIRRWWQRMGRKRYPKAKRLLITADCSGSNGARVRLRKVELQNLANQTGLATVVTHHPPSTSKWNRIEHRMFAFITRNWRAKPLLSHKVIVQLIAATSTTAGLPIACDIDASKYPKGIKVPDQQVKLLNIRYDGFHPEWNYTIIPKNRDSIIACILPLIEDRP